MNIKPITPVKINYPEIKQRQNKQKNTSKNNIKKAIIITGAISAAALAGMLIVKKTNLLNKFPSVTGNGLKQYKNGAFDAFCNNTKQTDTQIIKTTLPNGIEKIEKISKNTLYGTSKKTKLSQPINGIKTIKSFSFPNGDISHMTSFDASGNVIKNIQYNHSYTTKKRLENIVVSTSKGKTQIEYEFLKHLPEKVKSVKISYPDGTTKLTSIPISIMDKLADLIHR